MGKSEKKGDAGVSFRIASRKNEKKKLGEVGHYEE